MPLVFGKRILAMTLFHGDDLAPDFGGLHDQIRALDQGVINIVVEPPAVELKVVVFGFLQFPALLNPG